jgi:hypothetical protein
MDFATDGFSATFKTINFPKPTPFLNLFINMIDPDFPLND